MLKIYAKAKTLLWSLKDDTEGATIIEYSLLIGLITVVAVGSLFIVGTWIGVQWTGLIADAKMPTV